MRDRVMVGLGDQHRKVSPLYMTISVFLIVYTMSLSELSGLVTRIRVRKTREMEYEVPLGATLGQEGARKSL